ncbi:hypothetical protein SUGI_0447400 [Cryptomeria japonica]|uniref:uncharacterized protein LOC131074832 n=1 Tax=Cryptomeria japonica TaxID=3369 RepID=UPI002408C3A9|nr:uncharacterized protein LOC131074832 [Cryptomeria japonica]GLJ23624.1 hypothetical protein SUGI_0447400 [Cryptomeria japonica]
MEGSSGDPLKGRTFAIELTSDGAARLREVIKQKLADFMGSYTDDVLAEYVVVLVCHGKHQDQAKKDLNAFLGDHSSAFVAWLWDHVASNIHDYLPSSQTVQPVDIKEQAKNHFEEGLKRGSEKRSRSIDMETKSKGDNVEPVSVVTHKEVMERSTKVPGTRRRREWASAYKSSREVKEMPRDETPRHQTEYEERNDSRASRNSHSRGKSGSKRRHSPEIWTQREQLRHDEGHADKRKSSPAGLHATRRLLQSAVREAVGPIGPTHSKRLESSRKRLRSVVSTHVEDSNELSDAFEDSNRPRVLANSLPAMAVAVKAAAAAAEDVAKLKSTGSVFDRLGKKLGSDVNRLHEDIEKPTLDDEGNDIENAMTEGVYRGRKFQNRSEIHNRLNRGLIDDIAMMDRESVMPLDPTSEGYDEVEDSRQMRHYTGSSTRRKQLENRESDVVSRVSNFKERQPLRHQEPNKHPEESVTVQYRVAKNSQDMARENRVQRAASETTSASGKILNISVNVNTWKPTHFQSSRDAVAMKTKTSNVDPNLLQDHTKMDIDGTLPDDTEMGVKNEVGQIVPVTEANGASNADFSSDIRKGTSTSGVGTSGRTPEDADSRTVFVSNVHFAATKESLSKHFGRYGEVVKVIIQTDATTSQPKGSAYIEFASKEMAEMALALNETSFMSRMLKVMRKTASNSNVEPSIIARPPLRCPFPFLSRPPARAVYGRGFLGTYRRAGYMARPFGSTRSFQWRRDKASGTSEISGGSSSECPAPSSSVPASGGIPTGLSSAQLPRPLTYVRNATKPSIENAGQA